MLFLLTVLATIKTKQKIASAVRDVLCNWLGYAYSQDAGDAQKTLGAWAFYRRYTGLTSWKLEDVLAVADDWGINPAELICRIFQEYNGSTLYPIAEKMGLTLAETERRFEAKLAASRLTYNQLYLLVLSEQVKL